MEIITTHLHADFDGLAAMIAARKLYPKAIMVFPGSQEKNLRDFFAQSTTVYNFQRLKNIDLDKVTKLIIVDTRQKNRIGNFAECLNNKKIEIHLYDHHPDTPEDIPGDFELVRLVGSTTTLFTQLFRDKGIKVNAEEATLMAMAIHEDTGSFTFDSTTSEDLEAAAWLLKKGADLSAVPQYISQELSTQELGVLNKLIKSARVYTIQGINIVVAKVIVPEYLDEFALLVKKFMVIENLNTLFALAHMGDRIYLIARSRIPEVNVGLITQEFGGGGHATAASSTVKNMTLIEAEEKLINLLHKYISPARLAKDLMSSPVISVPPDISIDEANLVLTRYNITVLPVAEDRKKIIGLISRRIAEKAIYHGLGQLPVSDYMNTDFVSLPPTASLARIQELIIEHRQRFIPVVDNDEIIGVITRTDLLNILIKDPAYSPSDFSQESLPSNEKNKNLNNLLVSSLSRELIVLLRTIGETAQSSNYAAYIVGGFVRDLLLHIPNMDLDVVIEGDGIDFAKKLARKLGGKARAHAKFNTAVVVLPNGFKIDVATARLEYYEYPAAMPTVELSSIKLDLFRRDFTVNALAIHLNPDRFGTLVDFFNCQNDIRDRQIRVIHNLSFVEDPTRIFRALRFEQRMGFQLGKLTEKLIKNAVKMDMFNRFSGRRFLHELRLILSEENPLDVIERMSQYKLLKFLHPSLSLDIRLQKVLEETQQGINWYKLLYFDEEFFQWKVYLLTLTSKLTTRQMMDFCERFEMPEKTLTFFVKEKIACSKILKILNQRSLDLAPDPATIQADIGSAPKKKHHFTIQGPALRPSDIYRILQGLSIEGLLFLMGTVTKKSGKKAVSLYVTKLRLIKTIIHGADLKAMGYKSGPLFGIILNDLLMAKIDGHLAGRKEEERFVKKYFPLAKRKKTRLKKARQKKENT